MPPSPDPPSPLRAPRHGRLLDDFVPGAVYEHPWEVTVDAGMVALFAASFQDATPTWASRLAAADLGFADRPLSPLLLLNLGLSFSVHDVSEQAIAHLAYIDVRFPAAAFVGDTVRARSRVLGVKRVSSRDKGVVHVRTELDNQDGEVVCTFERKALVRTGHAVDRPPDPGGPPPAPPPPDEAVLRVPPSAWRRSSAPSPPGASTSGRLKVGDVFAHTTAARHETARAAGHHAAHSTPCTSTSLVRQAVRQRACYGGGVAGVGRSAAAISGNGIWELGLEEGGTERRARRDTCSGHERGAKEAGANAGKRNLRIVGVKKVRRGPAEAATTCSRRLGKADAKVRRRSWRAATRLLWRAPRTYNRQRHS